MKLCGSALTLFVVASFLLSTFAEAQQAVQQSSPYVNGRPMFVFIPGGNADDAMIAGFAGTNIPMWSSTFNFSGTTYTYKMIGTNPASGSVTTNVPLVIIPLIFKFSNGTVLSATSNVCKDTASAVTRVQNSPLILKTATFKPGGTNVGTTQYIDAFQRANFWGTVSSHPNSHLLLNASVLAEQTLSPSRTYGKTGSVFGFTAALVDINWFDSQIPALISKFGFSPTSFLSSCCMTLT